MSDFSSGGLGSEFSELVGRKNSGLEAELDMTSMVDLVFMMTIYFLLTALTAVLAQVDLPAARNVSAADESSSVIVTVVIRGDPRAPIVYLGKENEGPGLTDIDEQSERITAAVEGGPVDDEGNISVMIKAEKKVRFGDMMRIAQAVGAVENAKMYVAVLELD